MAKLSGRDAAGFIQRPDPGRPGILIYGADPMRVGLKRQDLVLSLVGPDAEAEMRLERLSGADLRRDKAGLVDAMKAQGFFPGPRAVVVEEATDGTLPAMEAALSDWAPGDAMLVATAAQLPARSKLRKLFEGHPSALCLAVYDDPMSRAEMESELNRAGLDPRALPRDAMRDLEALAQALAPGDFRQTVEKVALFKRGDTSPLTGEEIAALAPATFDAAVDDLLHAAFEGRGDEIGPLMQRLTGQGVTPVSLAIAALRHVRALHAAAAHPDGPSAGVAKMRPPVFGPRRDRMIRQASGLGLTRAEAALEQVLDLDLTLRSGGQTAPEMALVERTLIRLAMLARARR